MALLRFLGFQIIWKPFFISEYLPSVNKSVKKDTPIWSVQNLKIIIFSQKVQK